MLVVVVFCCFVVVVFLFLCLFVVVVVFGVLFSRNIFKYSFLL